MKQRKVKYPVQSVDIRITLTKSDFIEKDFVNALRTMADEIENGGSYRFKDKVFGKQPDRSPWVAQTGKQEIEPSNPWRAKVTIEWAIAHSVLPLKERLADLWQTIRTPRSKRYGDTYTKTDLTQEELDSLTPTERAAIEGKL